MTLTFDQLRIANELRCNTAFAHKLEDWSLTDWACAMAGEAGEVCNLVKKIRREDFSKGGVTITDLTPSGRSAGKFAVNSTGSFDEVETAARTALAKEIADTVCYCDLLAARAGIDLGEAVRQKFNEVSDRRKSDIKL